MDRMKKKAFARKRIHWRIRKKVFGTPERPRVCIRRTLKHIYAQAIDDTSGHTILQCSTLDPDVRKTITYGGNIAAAKVVGEVLAKRLKEKGVEQVVFDRGGHRYHGRVKALADAMREQGLIF